MNFDTTGKKRAAKEKLNERFKRIFSEPAKWLLGRLPSGWRKKVINRVKLLMEGQYAESDEQIEKRTYAFLIRECMIIFWGICSLLVIMAVVVCIGFLKPEKRTVDRNSFGEGAKEVSVVLKKGGKTKEYALALAEQRLTVFQENKLKEQFFQQLEKHMAGKNSSLQKVIHPICLEDTLKDWPFYITYRLKDVRLIRLDGSIADISEFFPEKDSIDTSIFVRAEYGPYQWTKRYKLRLMAHKKRKNLSVFEKAAERLQKLEEKTRERKSYRIPSLEEGVQIETKKEPFLSGILLLGAGGMVLFFIHNFFNLREKEKLCRKQTLRDFPTIVHLLALYMGAGLSLSSSVSRIVEDYQKRSAGKKKYAFEEIIRMHKQMKLGVSQKEACIQWGKRYKEPVYHKLSLTLLQVIAKGTREGRILMEHMEKEAFRHRIDMAKKEGEEASTKLLFPMLVLLCLVMIMIMFPAIIRFRGV